MGDWDGKEHRASNVTLGDILLELREVKGDVKNLLVQFAEHKQDDKSQFGEIKKDVLWIQRLTFGAIGAYFLVQFLIQLGALNLNSRFLDTNNRGYTTNNLHGYNSRPSGDIKGEGRLA